MVPELLTATTGAAGDFSCPMRSGSPSLSELISCRLMFVSVRMGSRRGQPKRVTVIGTVK